MERSILSISFTDDEQPRLQGNLEMSDTIDERIQSVRVEVVLSPESANRQTSYEELEKAIFERTKFFLAHILKNLNQEQ